MSAKKKIINNSLRLKKIAIAAITTAVIGTGVAVTQLPYFVGENVISILEII